MLQVSIFVGGDMLPDLLLPHQLLLMVQQLIDGVGIGIVQLKALNLDPDGCQVGHLPFQVAGSSRPSLVLNKTPLPKNR